MRAQFKRWVLLSGHRHLVAIGMLFLMLGVVLVPNLTRFSVRNIAPLTYMASAFVTGNITLITVVVAINQVILSQELESPDSLKEEIERTAEYRQAALDQQPIPTDPSDFLHQLLQQTRQHALSLEAVLPGTPDEGRDELVTDLPKQCEQISDQLEPASDTLSNVIAPILGVDFGDFIHQCHRLQARYGEESREQLHTMLDQVASDLENLDVARQYFTTIFMKEELAKLSRSLLYIGLLSVSVPLTLLFQLTTYTGSSPSMPRVVTLSVLTVLIGLLPLAILIAFVLRIATVAQQIAAITPFTS